MIIRSLLLAALLMATPAAASPNQVTLVQAVQPSWVFPMQAENPRQDILPLRQVVDMVRGRFGGELISARLEQGQRPVYVLRWRMPDSQVRDIRVDAASGQFR